MKKKTSVLDQDKAYDEIKKITEPIFNKVLSEGHSNSMSIVKNPKKRAWRPNNYRRQMKVKTKLDSTIKNIKTAIGSRCSVGKRNKLLFIRCYDNILIQYGKNTLTATYCQNKINGEKEVYLIEGNTEKEIEEFITKKAKEIRLSIDKALFDFSRKFNIILPFEVPIWGRFEDWTTDAEIEKLPKESTIHIDNKLKKVYDVGIEYTGGLNDEPTKQLINRIHNDGLRNLSPVLDDRLNKIEDLISKLFGLQYIKSKVNKIDDVFKLKNDILFLSKEDKLKLGSWLFEKFGGGEICLNA